MAARAHGTGSGQELLLPVIEALRSLLEDGSLITADAGYHSEANLKALEAHRIDSLIADNGLRQRDVRLTDQIHHRQQPSPLYDRDAKPPPVALFQPAEFQYDPIAKVSRCPAGKRLYRNGANVVVRGLVHEKYRGAVRDCTPCALRTQCLRTPGKTRTRPVVLFRGRLNSEHESATARMRRRIDSAEERPQYGRRFAI